MVRITDRKEQLSAQCAAWTPTFARDGDLPADAEAVARGWSRTWPFAMARVPSSPDYGFTAAPAHHSQAGPDGLPYCAWARGGELAEQVLESAADWQLQGLPLPLSFNESVAVFPPKGSKEEDATGIWRAPDETRPLGLKNTDAKIINGTIAHAISPVV